MDKVVRREDVSVKLCNNSEADHVFVHQYWMTRVRRSRRISYEVWYNGVRVGWIQCADPFGTKLAKPLQVFDINEAVELCRGYFYDDAPSNIESCAIGKVLRQVPNQWYKDFKVIKKVALIYQDIDVAQKGIVYRALGFVPYAKCLRARHYSAPKHGDSKGQKILWARSLSPVSGQHYKVIMPVPELVFREEDAN